MRKRAKNRLQTLTFFGVLRPQQLFDLMNHTAHWLQAKQTRFALDGMQLAAHRIWRRRGGSLALVCAKLERDAAQTLDGGGAKSLQELLARVHHVHLGA